MSAEAEVALERLERALQRFSAHLTELADLKEKEAEQSGAEENGTS